MKISIIVACLFVYTTCLAWQNTITHLDLSGAAAMISVIDHSLLDKEYSYKGELKNLLFWLEEGSKLEDAGSIYSSDVARYRNHFHNPLANLTPPIGILTQGGLTDLTTGQSTLFWAQDGQNQSHFVGGDWSWQTIRTHYFRSLTTTSKAGIEMFTAMTYLGLGYQMHLVQDMSQPDHVRNDAHPIDGSDSLWGFETWSRKKRSLIQQYAATASRATLPTVNLTQPLYDGYAPVGRLLDTRRYAANRTPSAAMNQGLAEYTNANFFSDDTVFAARYALDDKHYFPYPRKEGTNIRKYFDGTLAPETVPSEDGKFVSGLWISKIAEGETIPHLVRVGTLADFAYAVFGEGTLFYDRLYRDEITYNDYARILVPRAVGYSAALLDYFFRGKLVLAVAAPQDITFRSVKVTATNNTPNEAMGLGDVSLVVRYKALAETGSGPVKTVNDPSDDYSYKVATLSNVNMANSQELIFDFSSDALPAYFDDISLRLVFKGKLGAEDTAVAISPFVAVDSIYTDFELSLPASGVYAKTSDTTVTATFDELRVTALTNIPGGLSGGTISLALDYRLATDDPFQSQQVPTEPATAVAYIIRLPERDDISSLAQGVPTELVFDLSSAPLPAKATDVYLNVVYNRPGDNKPIAIGYRDISEPTPIDVFNNADKRCINRQWYDAGSPEAIAQVDTNHNGIAEEEDVYAHIISNIYYKASSTSSTAPTSLASASNYTFSSSAVLFGGAARRLGFILTDYNFKLSCTADWLNTHPLDPWVFVSENIRIFNGVAVNNQDYYPLMSPFRKSMIWNGGRFIFMNTLDEDAQCGWDKLLPLP